MNNVSRSFAGSGEGVFYPEDISAYNITQAGKRVGLVIRWDGNGYDRRDSWIRGDGECVIELDSFA